MIASIATSVRQAALVEQFVRVVREQHEALIFLENARCNRLVLRMMAIIEELKAMDGDQRRALLPLLRSQDVWIRFRAAQAVLALEPDVARRTIESIRASGVQPEAAEAASTLGNLDSGFFVPT